MKGIRDRFFTFLGEITTKRYGYILLGGFLLMIVCIWLASKLHLEMTWLSMMPQDDRSVIEYKKILKEFESATPIIITIEGKNLNRLKLVAKRLATSLKKIKEIRAVRYRIDKDFLQRYALIIQKARHIKRLKNILKDLSIENLITHINDDFEREYIEEVDEPLAKREKKASQFLQSIANMLLYLNSFLQTGKDKYINMAIDEFTTGDGYFVSPDKDMLLIIATSSIAIIDTTGSVAISEKIDKIIKDIQKDYSNIKIGHTGAYAIAKDEMYASLNDTKFNLISATIIVLVLFIVSFRMFSSPFLAMLSLIIGVIWSLGATYILIGKLNLLTAMVSVFLIGLGIDYSIHIISGLTQQLQTIENYNLAFKEMFIRTGKGILTGALTTAIAFFVFVFTDVSFMKELGLVLGLGIIFTFIAALLLLPSMIVLKDKINGRFNKQKELFKNKNMELKLLGSIVVRSKAFSIIVLSITLLITIAAIFQIPKLRFSGDLRKFEAEGLLSLELMDRVEEKFDMSTDPVVMTVDTLKESEELTKRLDKLASVGFVDSISVYLPAKEKQLKRLEVIKEVKDILIQSKIKNTINKKLLIREIKRLEANYIELSDIAYMGGLDRIVKRCDKIANLKEGKKAGTNIFDRLIASINGADDTRLKKIESIFINGLKERFLLMCSINGVSMKDIPEDIKDMFIGRSGKYLISIYPSKDVWKDIADSRFLKDVRAVAGDRITGMVEFMYMVIEYAKRGGKLATLFSIIMIFLLVLIDFRSLRFALISLIPLIVGSIWTLAFLYVSGFELTYMTVMVVPLIIGIGIDDGVHIIHRYRIEKDIRKALSTTGKAVVLTSLTTMVAFGSLAFSRMVGYRHFGITLFAGIGFLLLLSVVLLPSIIYVFNIRDK